MKLTDLPDHVLSALFRCISSPSLRRKLAHVSRKFQAISGGPILTLDGDDTFWDLKETLTHPERIAGLLSARSLVFYADLMQDVSESHVSKLLSRFEHIQRLKVLMSPGFAMHVRFKLESSALPDSDMLDAIGSGMLGLSDTVPWKTLLSLPGLERVTVSIPSNSSKSWPAVATTNRIRMLNCRILSTDLFSEVQWLHHLGKTLGSGLRELNVVLSFNHFSRYMSRRQRVPSEDVLGRFISHCPKLKSFRIVCSPGIRQDPHEHCNYCVQQLPVSNALFTTLHQSCPELEKLEVERVMILDDEFWLGVRRLKALTHLSVEGCKCISSASTVLDSLASLSSLRRLIVDCCNYLDRPLAGGYLAKHSFISPPFDLGLAVAFAGNLRALRSLLMYDMGVMMFPEQWTSLQSRREAAKTTQVGCVDWDAAELERIRETTL